MNDEGLESLFGGQGWLFSLGWWGKSKRSGFSEEEEDERFSIDVVRAE
jgi:hypothetical protein